MLIKRPDQLDAQTMSIPGARGVRMRVVLGRADGAPTFAMRHFEVEPGGHTPLHQHNYEHEVLILDGQGLVTGGTAGATTRPIAPGDVVYIPANETHQFRNTGGATLRFMCLIPTSFDCGQNACQPTPGS